MLGETAINPFFAGIPLLIFGLVLPVTLNQQRRVSRHFGMRWHILLHFTAAQVRCVSQKCFLLEFRNFTLLNIFLRHDLMSI